MMGLLSWLRRPTIESKIAADIDEAERTLYECNKMVEHYISIADMCEARLDRLRALRDLREHHKEFPPLPPLEG